jgi:prophage antirepressor-like protein
MEDIYDKSKWPTAGGGLRLMLLSDQEWFTNEELVTYLGLSTTRALISQSGPTFRRSLADGDTAVMVRGQIIPTSSVNPAHSGRGNVRLFSRRAVVLAAMRTNTVEAAAFRDWLATFVAKEMFNG